MSTSNEQEQQQSSSSLKDKFFQLQLRMRQCKQDNLEHVVQEKQSNQRSSLPNNNNNNNNKTTNTNPTTTSLTNKNNNHQQLQQQPLNKNIYFKHKRELLKELEENTNDITLEQSDKFEKKRKRKDQLIKPQGWEVYNKDFLHQTHNKRIKEALQNKLLPNTSSTFPGLSSSSSSNNSKKEEEEGHDEDNKEEEEYNNVNYLNNERNETEELKNRMAEELNTKIEKRKAFSRVRKNEKALLEGKDDNVENVDYINDQNRKYNKALSKAYDKYTQDIRNNLERGTAIN
ncbi:hypothetical protein ABK040_015060 [Willaertia magna]